MIKKTHGSLFKKQYHALPLCLSLLAMNQVHALEAGASPVSKTYVDQQDGVLQTQITQLQGSGTTYTVGQQALGGIVFYVDSTGSHGLVAAATDNNSGTAVSWNGYSGGSSFVTNATGNGIGAGQMNTSLIISEQSAYFALTPSGLTAVNSAAKVCLNYAIQADGTTACASPGTAGAVCYADWYLPSQFELNQMYLQKAEIGGFSLAYWSSTEATPPTAFVQDFEGGTQGLSLKSINAKVRCVRAF